MRERDEELAERAAAGDRRALETLLERHADRIHAVCRRLLTNREDALDATQEAMIAVARGVARFDGRSAFTTWLYRVATNAALDEGRRKKRRPEPVEHLPEPVSRTPAFDEQVAAAIDLDGALRELPEEFRVAVVLRDLCDLDYAEIAEILDIAPGTVRSRIARGRLRLHEQLRPRTRTENQPRTRTDDRPRAGTEDRPGSGNRAPLPARRSTDA